MKRAICWVLIVALAFVMMACSKSPTKMNLREYSDVVYWLTYKTDEGCYTLHFKDDGICKVDYREIDKFMLIMHGNVQYTGPGFTDEYEYTLRDEGSEHYVTVDGVEYTYRITEDYEVYFDPAFLGITRKWD